jgi:transcriptional antiterminator RfaH
LLQNTFQNFFKYFIDLFNLESATIIYKQLLNNNTEEPLWYAIRTRFKAEKVVSKLLEKKEIQNYLPLQKLVRAWGRRKQLIEKPLFNNYIFVKITKSQKVKVLETEHIINFVQLGKELNSIPEKEIETIKWVLGNHDQVSVLEDDFNIGDKVEIIAGSLTGLKGRLLENKGKKTFIIDFEEIGKGLMLEIDSLSFRKI